MTQDKARKTATRQRMAETGEPYSVARHAVEREQCADEAPGGPAPDSTGADRPGAESVAEDGPSARAWATGSGNEPTKRGSGPNEPGSGPSRRTRRP